jgi:sarcosine oxidase
MAPRGVRTGHHKKVDFLGRTIAVARRHGIPHEVLEAPEIAARFPMFALKGDEVGYLEPGAGYVRPEACIAAELAEAARLGARIETGCRVLGLIQRGDGVVIETTAGTIEAGQAVVAAGAWAGGLLGAPYDRLLAPVRQVLHWYPLTAAALAEAPAPAFIWMHGTTPEDYFYGFPAVGGAVKLASEQYAESCDPDALDRAVGPDEAAACLGYLHRQLALVEPDVVLCVGRIAAHNLLGTDQALARLRGRRHELPGLRAPVVVTYHPAYLLRTPADKRKAWEDLQFAAEVARGARA